MENDTVVAVIGSLRRARRREGRVARDSLLRLCRVGKPHPLFQLARPLVELLVCLRREIPVHTHARMLHVQTLGTLPCTLLLWRAIYIGDSSDIARNHSTNVL